MKMSETKGKEEKIENIDRKLNVLLGTFVIFICILIFTTLQNGHVSCRFFIPNIYMYVILAILLIGIFTLLREKYFTSPSEQYKLYDYRDLRSMNNFASGIFIGLMGIIVLFIYGLFQMSTYKNHILNHVVWLFVIFSISALFYPLFKLKTSYNYIDNAVIYVLMIFIVMSGIVYTNYKSVLAMNNNTFAWIGMGLLGGLLTIIFGSLLLIIFSMFGLIPVQNFLAIHKIILYVGIVLFSLYISYDSIYIIKRTKTCNESNVNKYPNYPMESFQIFIDLYNIFANLLQLQLLGNIS